MNILKIYQSCSAGALAVDGICGEKTWSFILGTDVTCKQKCWFCKYDATGTCMKCRQDFIYASKKCEKKMFVVKNGVKVYDKPYSAATVVGILEKNENCFVKATLKNAFGNQFAKIGENKYVFLGNLAQRKPEIVLITFKDSSGRILGIKTVYENVGFDITNVVPSNQKNGAEFIGWVTTKDATCATYHAENSIVKTEKDLTLFPVYK